jgi:hypothetical protein
MMPLTRNITRVYGKAETYVDVMPGEQKGVLLDTKVYGVILDADGVTALIRALQDALAAAIMESKNV